ncbi:hypothetical protein ACWET9_22590 [Streptomyces sp. NPDC004059]
MSKPTLLLITAAGLFAALGAASWAQSGLATLVVYVAVVASLAHATGAPVARTLGASLLVIATALIVTLHALRKLLDVALWLLNLSTQGALITAKALS